MNRSARRPILIALPAVALVVTVARPPDSVRAGYTIQRFPPAGSCTVTGSGLYVLPDPRCTPGALDRKVTQATVGQTICRSGWSRSVRPPESVTEPEKRAAIAAYGHYDGPGLRNYELDHLIPLSLGGAANAAANLWPEPDYPRVIAGARSYYLNPKDRLESRLHSRVCDGRMTLASARQALRSNWVAAFHDYVRG
jgi:hypothetical protein